MIDAIAIDDGVVREVMDTCLCFAVQKAARALSRRFDRAFAGQGLTSGQYAMLMEVNRMGAPRALDLAVGLVMDRATVTAALKKLSRRRLVSVSRDRRDGRARRVTLTAEGRRLLALAVPLWRVAQAAIETELPEGDSAILRRGLRRVGGEAAPPDVRKPGRIVPVWLKIVSGLPAGQGSWQRSRNPCLRFAAGHDRRPLSRKHEGNRAHPASA